MDTNRKIQQYFIALLILGLVFSLPYIHFRINQIQKKEPIEPNYFDLEEIAVGTFPEKKEFLIAANRFPPISISSQDKRIVELYFLKNKAGTYFAAEWKADFPPEEFSDCSFVLEDQSGKKVLIGDILSIPRKHFFSRYLLDKKMDLKKIHRVIILRNYDNTVIASSRLVEP